jgi:DNA polymerase IV (DinB-like DNA polymerase)
MEDWQHVIIHIDLDCFFAAVHTKHHSFLKDRPVIIGSDPREGNGRGVISTCSYEARRYGLHSGMPISRAYQLCPDGIYICSRQQISFPEYATESEKVMEILREFSSIFQYAGMDEAYLDVTERWREFGDTPYHLAKRMQTTINQKVGLSISIGVAESKSIAKIASDLDKPGGITLIPNSEIPTKLYHLPVRKIVGVGKKTEASLHKKGLQSIGDIAGLSREKTYLLLGDWGLHLKKVVQGKNFKEVGNFRGQRQSISSERTFGTDQNNWSIIREKVAQITNSLSKRLIDRNLVSKTISIKIRFQGFQTFTRSHSFRSHIADEKIIYNTALNLLQEFTTQSGTEFTKPVRLIGVKVSSLKSSVGQTSLESFFN